MNDAFVFEEGDEVLVLNPDWVRQANAPDNTGVVLGYDHMYSKQMDNPQYKVQLNSKSGGAHFKGVFTVGAEEMELVTGRGRVPAAAEANFARFEQTCGALS